jgi:hypothetical protein
MWGSTGRYGARPSGGAGGGVRMERGGGGGECGWHAVPEQGEPGVVWYGSWLCGMGEWARGEKEKEMGPAQMKSVDSDLIKNFNSLEFETVQRYLPKLKKIK